MMMCESAARLGLYSLTITDHCECNCYRAEGYDKSIRQS
ncbi:MAG TPA: histidinol phosphate phosphatase, partial [Ruminococcaceae bacterium]|nr:histidinol phosphate phosphatase [Oscillospiraceae bacterium]